MTEIYYFSGTGNSLHVAKEIQKRIPEIKLIPMVRLLNQKVIETNADSVGFVFPVYVGMPPIPVRQFIRKIDLKNTGYVFAVITHINYKGFTVDSINRTLKQKGKVLDSYFFLNMASNSPTGLIPKFLPVFKENVEKWAGEITEEKVSNLEARVRIDLDSIQKAIINKQKVPQGNVSKPANLFLIGMMESLTEKMRPTIPYFADSTCNGCGICEKVCLSKKVIMKDDKPLWQKKVNCYYCYSCFNSCPKQSILINKKYYKKNGRYFHPEVTANEIAGQKEGC